MFLLLGAILNVALAWGLAIWTPMSDAPRVGFVNISGGGGSQEAWVVRSSHAFGSTWVSSTWLMLFDGRTHLEGQINESLPNWADISSPAASYVQGDVDLDERIALARGFPALTLWCDLRLHDPESDYGVDGGAKLGWIGDPSTYKRFPRVLPLRPIWPGFAINTIFYAVIVWLLFSFPFTLRRTRRIKCGLCLKCGYDLRGSDSQACPECGKPIANRVVIG